MKTTLIVCLVLMFFTLPLHFFYWKLFRPVLLTRLRYRLFQARDELRLLVIAKEIGEKDKAYPILERNCGMCIQCLEHFDLAFLFNFHRPKIIDLKVQQDLEIINEASPKLRKVQADIRSAVIGAILVNSPGFLLFLVPIVSVAVIAFYWFIRVRSYFRELEKCVWIGLYNSEADC